MSKDALDLIIDNYGTNDLLDILNLPQSDNIDDTLKSLSTKDIND